MVSFRGLYTYFFKNDNRYSALARIFGTEYAMEVYKTYQMNLQTYNQQYQRQIQARA